IIGREDPSDASYKKDSIKEPERICRRVSKKLIIKGLNTRIPNNWKEFLLNDENEMQLSQLILEEWKKIKERQIHVVRSVQCTSDRTTVTHRVEPSLKSSHKEVDTKIILHAINMK
ncbi:unnamed protein product, partial [Owenia fusiformis]